MSEVILCTSSCFSLWQRAKNAFQNRLNGAKRGLVAAEQKFAEGKEVPIGGGLFFYENYSSREQRGLRKLAAIHGFLKPDAYPRQPTP